jgi:hypothetical protein
LIDVREACDVPYVASLFPQLSAGSIEAAAAYGLRFFEVWDSGERCGLFAVLPSSQVAAELHTELRFGGAKALLAGRVLVEKLRADGLKTLTTYATAENRIAMVMARAFGFRRDSVDPLGTVHYVLQL